MSNLTVALIQQSCSGNRDANISKTIAMIREAKKKPKIEIVSYRIKVDFAQSS